VSHAEAKRIGVFGGTFDPVHNAHLDIARAALAFAELDEVLFVVAARPPHKQSDTNATPEQRFAMVEAALESEPAMRASDLELRREGPSYTADTLRQLKNLHPGAKLFLIIGIDSLVDLPKWREPEAILERTTILVVPRPGDDWSIPEALDGKYAVLPFDQTVVSSTNVRQRLAEGSQVTDLVPRRVARLIESKGIYDEGTGRATGD